MRLGFFAAVTAAIAAPVQALEMEEMALEPFEQDDEFSLAELGFDEDDFNLAELGLDDFDFAELGLDEDDLAELGSDDEFDYPEFDDEFDLAELGSDDELDLPEMEDSEFDEDELNEMLAELGIDNIEELFSQVSEENVDDDNDFAEEGEKGWVHLHLMQRYAHLRRAYQHKAKHALNVMKALNRQLHAAAKVRNNRTQ